MHFRTLLEQNINENKIYFHIYVGRSRHWDLHILKIKKYLQSFVFCNSAEEGWLKQRKSIYLT